MTTAGLSYKSLVESFREIDSWLSSKGVAPRSTDRIHRLINLVRECDPRVLGSEIEMTRDEQRQYMFALAELLEFHQIMLCLGDEDPTRLAPKLVRALSGSVDPVEETPKNNDGRNVMFELSLAAEWRRAGLAVEIGEPDIRLTVRNQVFLVECKRPFAWTGIRSCLKNATRQLQQSGASPLPGEPKGVIAISLNRIISAGRQFLSAESLADKTKVGEMIDCELEANRWAHYDRIRFDESMAAVAFHLNLPAHVTQGPQFALMSSLNPYKASTNDDALALFAEATSYGQDE